MGFWEKFARSLPLLLVAASRSLSGDLRPPPDLHPMPAPVQAVSEPSPAPAPDPVFSLEEIEASLSGRPAPHRPEREFDPLPPTMAAMGEYERIAMDPYADTYDSLPVEEKRERYARQFHLLHGRSPNFPPHEEATDSQAGSAGNMAAGGVAPGGVAYDPLPRRMADMDRLARIAMEPYADSYDAMPLSRQAEIYARQFEFMNNRPPRFPPDLRAALESGGGEGGSRKNARERKTRRGRDRRRGDERDKDAPATRAGTELPEDFPLEWFAGSGPHDPFPRGLADLSRHDRIALEPFLDRYETLPLAERVLVYGRQFAFMHDRPPRFHPSLLAELRGETSPEPESLPAMHLVPEAPAAGAVPAVPEKAAPLRPPPPSFDGFPRRMADMTRDERIAMEPYRERYDTLPVTERAMLYARMFQRLHGRFPKFPPPVMAEIGLSQYSSVDLEAMGLKEAMEALRAQAAPEYDHLPLTMAEMDIEARNALDPYRYGYDRFSLAEKARLYSLQFQTIYGRPPSFSPELVERIERSRQGIPEEPRIAPEAGDEVPAAATLPASRPPRAGRYDALPRRIGEMSSYDRIAMEPYWNTYDTLPLSEKARLYSAQFEFMQGRPPVFHPSVEEAIREDEANPQRSRRGRQLYRDSSRRNRLGIDPGALPGPWNPGSETLPGRDTGVSLHPDGTVYEERDERMDSFRQGWSLPDASLIP